MTHAVTAEQKEAFREELRRRAVDPKLIEERRERIAVKWIKRMRNVVVEFRKKRS
ncbi:hypothetical protein [Bradyrhizobium sp. SZCCHNRI1058]|uniref:hypothetical protein n=1 Tax=Bradyrhizobium sp. SZCCHNRI1058 TaxID=3057279 RepID=UPI002915EEFF|nr:hypothetical protein [Bradyrhizobium sp. SZCCHNRI1058]